jgi:hypothetical protein
VVAARLFERAATAAPTLLLATPSRREHPLDVRGRIPGERLPGLVALDSLGAPILFSFYCLDCV